MALSPKEERELVTKLEDMFQAAVEHPSWQEWRSTIAPKCFRYREGDQWTAAERATLKKRHQPEIINNQVSVTINRLVGQFVKQKVRIRYQGRNPKTDDLGAAALSDIMLFIRQVNGLEFEERDQIEEGFTSGFGCLELGVTWNDATSRKSPSLTKMRSISLPTRIPAATSETKTPSLSGDLHHVPSALE